MKKIIILLVIVVTVIGCSPEPKKFTQGALNDTFENLNSKKVTLQQILEKHKGKTILIDIWASWCPDCIKGMPKIKQLQKEYTNTAFVFLSLDKSIGEWKDGIKKYNVQGEHYFMSSGKEGGFSKFVNIDWIPRYMVVNKEGNIEVFKEVHADESSILKALK